MARPKTIYAVYDYAGNFVMEGTSDECAAALDVHPDTVKFWTSKAHKERTAKRKKRRGYTADRVEKEESEGEPMKLKIKADFMDVHAAIEALKNNEPLEDQERAAALDVLTAVIGKGVPTWKQVKQHQANVTKLKRLDYDKYPGQWQKLADQIREYENKFL